MTDGAAVAGDAAEVVVDEPKATTTADAAQGEFPPGWQSATSHVARWGR